ncbi:MAG: DUF445 domain-containing protein [Pseudohongiella sp.]|nr:DUF445 domain-containing protein [Pseudohongiella sp.]MDO9521402.1 DUF445 domain-containing protein [Pseudohongiella sp.]MDP2126138.1 DUF445 domain-containing protein [Pseudohongiella sp.]
MDRGLLTNLVAAALALAGLLLPDPIAPWVLSAGLFALSGAITNSLAIHMLFEKVPGFYGSGVIALHFEEFKRGIREMVMQQFFNAENIDRFFDSSTMMHSGINKLLPSMIDEMNLDKAFDSLVDAIMQSSMGGMLGMIGGPKALAGLREPFNERMRTFMLEMVESDEFQRRFTEQLAAATHSDAVVARIEDLVERRLQELTPEQVRVIVQKMIREHLGWLVVWGGVIGALMGLVFAGLSVF